MKIIKNIFLTKTHIAFHIKTVLKINRIPFIGKYVGLLLDRFLFIIYGIELESRSINVKLIEISHPGGVLLGGNGICSEGPLVISSGVKFVGKNPIDRTYLSHHADHSVFEIGKRVFIGANSVVIGPVKICDDVVIGALSVVTKNIDEPGIYVGIPAKKLSGKIQSEWFN